MTEPVLAYFAFMAVNVVISTVSAITFLGSVLPTIAYAIACLAAVSLVFSAVVLLALFASRHNGDNATPEEDEAQMAYVTEWNRLKKKSLEKTC